MLDHERLKAAVAQLLTEQFEGARFQALRPFGVDEGDDDAIHKSVGYGRPLLVEARSKAGQKVRFVLHTAAANPFGHDRRADRAAELLLAFDTFERIPRHTRALDVGAIDSKQSRLISLKNTGEFYLLTSYAEGHIYAEELSHIAQHKTISQRDRLHTQTLAEYLARLHLAPRHDKVAYTRSIRDLVGSGEGIFGIIDGYPESISDELRARLRGIEEQCLRWRWKLKDNPAHARIIHGDFHPFNIVFDDDELTLLDTSRGSLGDPADDVTCLSINYIFFALTHPGSWDVALAALWFEFWRRYLDQSRDYDIVERVAPFFTWRILVLASPAWYSGLSEEARSKLLELAERLLTVDRFDPAIAQDLF